MTHATSNAPGPASGPAAPAPFVVRPYAPGDETRIIDLYERTFGRTMGRTESERHWRWEFADNPTGKMAILLAFSGERLAAQYAVSPQAVWVDGAVRGGALSLDTATAPEFRGRGLFPKLATALYDELARQGAFAVFGFPNAASAPSFFRKLGWFELGPFPLLVKPLRGAVRSVLAARGVPRALAAAVDPLAAVLRAGPRPVPAGLRVVDADAFPPEVDALWTRARSDKRICVVRDHRYLTWRYVRKPEGGPYRIRLAFERSDLVGYVVTLVEERFSMRSGFVMDLLFEGRRRDVGDALVGEAERVMREAGAQLLTALMYPGSAARAALRAGGFLPVPRRFMPQEIHFGARRLAEGADEALLRDPAAWYVTWGDSDVV